MSPHDAEPFNWVGVLERIRREIREQLASGELGHRDPVEVPTFMELSQVHRKTACVKLNGYTGGALPPKIPTAYRLLWNKRRRRLIVVIPPRT